MSADIAPDATARRPQREATARLWSGLLLAVPVLLLLVPLALLLLDALIDTDSRAGDTAFPELSVRHFADVLADPALRAAILNGVAACGGGTVVAVIIGFAFAWIVVRTDAPGKRFIAAAGLLPLLMPPLVAGIAWSMPAWPGLEAWVDLRSLSGIIILFGFYHAPYVALFTAAALWRMDPTLEDAAELAGAGALRRVATVTLPSILPMLLSTALLAFAVMLGNYGIPAALGTPGHRSLPSTAIFALAASPGHGHAAAALAVMLAGVTALLVLPQHRILVAPEIRPRAGGAFRPRQVKPRAWQWLMPGLAALYLLLVLGLPLLGLLLAAQHDGWLQVRRLFQDPQAMSSIGTTLRLALVTAFAGTGLALAIAYTLARTRVPGRWVIGLLATLPLAVPGLVIGFAHDRTWIDLSPGSYGTVSILALAFVIRFLPIGIRAASAALAVVHKDLEEAAWICGHPVPSAIRTIVLPLARPGLAAALVLSCILTIRELGTALLLCSDGDRVMTVQVLAMYERGDAGLAAVLSLVLMLLLGTLLGGAAWLLRVGARPRRR
ncbi:ABC transporter permease [Rhodovastum atsumiense]|uniref:Iron ABC transporter permease n=1 Tax=Rhodovastum atsumiense TaxID=504468 RepID=A0A5M6ITY3_9PROT|nr:iron ABC transporter permease [Rhodovastum atsumiense]KAA5611722.1 iron ABC transporter permease [Rhodovastum atsumiense]